MRSAALVGSRGWLWLALVVSAAALVAADDGQPPVEANIPWTVELRNDDPVNGYVVYTRIPPGSDYAAYRLEAELDAPPEAVARAARAGLIDPDENRAGMSKEIVRDDGDVVIVYSFIDMPPLVADRDVVTRAVRRFDPATRTHRLEWQTSDEGPPPRKGVIRLQKSDGAWIFEPLDGERTRVIYESHTEIAGSIPAWLVNSLMNDTVVEGFEDLRARVASEAASGG